MDAGERRLRAVLTKGSSETGLDAQAIDAIVDNAQIAYFRAGATIERAHKSASMSKFVLSGVVRLMYQGARPDPMIVKFVKPGVPFVTVFERGTRPVFSAVAHQPAGVAFVSHEVVSDAAADLDRDGAARFAQHSWSVVSSLVSDKCELLTRNVSERLIHELTILSRDFGRPHSEGTMIDLMLTQEDLARLVVVDRSTVNRNLKELERAGRVLRADGRYVLATEARRRTRQVRRAS